MGIKELVLILLVIAIFIFGILAVLRTTKYSTGEKIYWIIIIAVFNLIGVIVFFIDKKFLKKNDQ